MYRVIQTQGFNKVDPNLVIEHAEYDPTKFATEMRVFDVDEYLDSTCNSCEFQGWPFESGSGGGSGPGS